MDSLFGVDCFACWFELEGPEGALFGVWRVFLLLFFLLLLLFTLFDTVIETWIGTHLVFAEDFMAGCGDLFFLFLVSSKSSATFNSGMDSAVAVDFHGEVTGAGAGISSFLTSFFVSCGTSVTTSADIIFTDY